MRVPSRGRNALVAALAVALSLAAPATADTWIVTPLSDENDGGDSGAGRSLREALADAVAGDAIEFAPALFSGGAATLLLELPTLSVTSSVAIIGPGADLLVIDGDGAGGLLRVESSADLEIHGVTLENGGGDGGSLVTVLGNLAVSDCVFRDSGTDDNGGAVFGAGVSSRIVLRDTLINECQSDGAGGGIYLANGTLVLDSVLVFACEAGSVGGGVAVANGTLLASNSTFSTNQSKGAGAGLHVASGAATLVNCTIAENLGGRDNLAGGRAGGIANVAGSVTLQNTLIAGNTGVPVVSGFDDSSPDVTGAFLADAHNLVGVGGAATGFGLSDIVLDADFPLFGAGDVYDEIGNNGGRTATHELIPGSPAINAGDGALARDPDTDIPLLLDQRGAGFPRVFGDVVDIGALETRPNTEDLGCAVAQAPGQVDPTNTLPIEFILSFSEPPLGFEAPDVAFFGTVGVTSFELVQTAPAVYALSVVAVDGDGTVSVGIPAGSVTDRFGRGFQASEGDGTVSYDTTSPVPLLASTAPAVVGGPFPVTVTFDEAVVDFGVSGLTLLNATALRTAGAPGSLEYTFTITPVVDGAVSVAAAAGAAADAAGNLSLPSNVLEVLHDATPPEVTIGTPAPSPTSSAPVPLTVEFSEPVSGFGLEDVVVSNGAALNPAGAGASYSVDIAPDRDGIVRVNVPAGAAVDAAGNLSLAAGAPLVIVYDTAAPTAVSVTRATDPPRTNADTVTFVIVFSEAVTGVSPDTFSVWSSEALVGAGLIAVQGEGDTFEVSVATGLGEGLLGVDVVPDGNVQDAAARPLEAGFETGEFYEVDRIAPVAVLTGDAADPTSTTPIPLGVEFDEVVVGLDLADFDVTGGTVSDLQGAEASYAVLLTPAGSGMVSVRVIGGAVEDLAGNLNAESSVWSRTFVDLSDCESEYHRIDTEQDHVVSLSELLRLIQFYNSGTFHCDETTEDGYAPGGGNLVCCPHDSDYLPQDWGISLSELLRSVQFYNSGGYRYCPGEGTEDAFCPGL